ncbi:MAG TPA: MotA/TolQ/ExbB proton channel family protein [Myxococcales bacterium]|nr:MotA/TolQ/ExbB proton channel family protein [Myxococcales bacterium]
MIEQRLLAFTLLGAGWVLWLLVALSVLSVAVMLERGLYFGQRRMSKRFPELLRLCQDGSLAKAAELAQGDAMEAEVVRAAARIASSGQEAVEKAVASTIDRRRLEYERWLFVLGTLGNNAPFIGLFGTVLGIIRAFADLATANKAGGSSTAAYVMAGISEALVATAVGLFVAIPAVLAFNIFQRLLKRVVGRSQSLGNAIAAGLHVARANGKGP